MPTYFIKTFGCQMNVNDSEVLAGLLEGAGYGEAASVEDADVILINTCCVRQKAEDKAMGFAMGLISPKMRKPDRVIALCGCIAEKDKNDIIRKLPFVDLVVGPGQEGKIVELINKVKGERQKIVTTGELRDDYPFRTIKRTSSNTAFIRIMTGCDNFCSFCIVPYVRGREMSRTAEDILKEIKDLDKDKFKEIVLLGQNVNSYRDVRCEMRDVTSSPISHLASHYGLANLLADVSKINGVNRIRFVTSHPRDMGDDIIDAVRELPKVCEYFHLPLQSGDDEILSKMNRGYTADHFRELVGRIRKKVPNAAITSDAIAGFPGETEEQFQKTLDLIKELEFDLVNTFGYSIRSGTAAAKMDGQLPKEVISERLQRLMKVVEASAFKRNRALVGSVQEVLVDSRSRKNLLGRTRGNKMALFQGPDELIGKIIDIKMVDAKPWVLFGQVTKDR